LTQNFWKLKNKGRKERERKKLIPVGRAGSLSLS